MAERGGVTMGQSEHPLAPLFAPRSIAFVGASGTPDSLGFHMMNMVRASGYDGRVYPVNPKYAELAGYECHPSITQLPEAVDLAVLNLANPRVEENLRTAIGAGARSVVIFANGLIEGDTDPPLNNRLAAIIREAGIPVLGSNAMGFYNHAARLRVCGFPALDEVVVGPIALITQSGSVFSTIAHNDPQLAFNLVVSSGREIVTTAADYLDYALEMESTRVAGLFIETVRDPEGFVAALEKAAARNIPVVVLKVGRSETGAAMAVSHTGAVAGNDDAYQAVFERHGVVRVDTLDEMTAAMSMFANPRSLGPGGLVVVQDSGGEREMVADVAERAGVPFATLEAATIARMEEVLEFGQEPGNPLDPWGTGKEFEGIFADCFQAMIDDPNAAMGLMMQDLRDGYFLSEGSVEACERVAAGSEKPVAFVTNFSGIRREKLTMRLAGQGIPVLDGTVPAMKTVRHMLDYRDFRNRPRTPPPPPPSGARGKWIERLGDIDTLNGTEAMELLADYGISIVESRFANTAKDAVAAAGAVGYPVVLKTAAEEVLHKADVGGVVTGIGDAEALRSAYADMAERLGAGVVVQPMAAAGTELMLGLLDDPQFGPIMVVGAGGILVEVLGDTVCAVPPLSSADGRRLVERLRVHRILKGVRGNAPANMEALGDVIARFSVMIADLAGAVAELDVNPVIVSPAGVIAVDALVIARR